MKKLLFLFIITFTFSFTGFAQESIDSFILPCDTLTTQVDLTMCSGKKCEILDSIVTTKVNCLVDYLESQKAKAIKDNDTSSTTYYSDIINAIDLSQSKWKELLNANMSIYSSIYAGGSIELFEMHNSAINDLFDRIKKLDDIIETISQGRDDRICK
jgi:uncharacterized protein YecT (DUF1311 family)